MTPPEDPDVARARLQRDVARVTKTLETLLVWMAQSATSPLRLDEAQLLLHMLRGNHEREED